jgi:hypothetical protein
LNVNNLLLLLLFFFIYLFIIYLFLFYFSEFDMMLLLFYSPLYHQQETYDELAFGHDATQLGLRKKVKEPNTW